MTRQTFMVVVGASAGGTLLLPDLLKQLKNEMSIAVFVVIHISKLSVGDMLASRLQKHTEFICKIPDHNEIIKARHVYIARPDHHLMVKKNKILLGKGPMENRYRPSIDSLFRSAAAAYDHRVIGIILSGMLEDGVSGMIAIKRSGGVCIIQDPSEAKYPDMPQSVLEHLRPDYSIPVASMGKAIEQAIHQQKQKPDSKIPLQVKKEAEISERVNIGIDQVNQIAERVPFSCPDCGGALWQMNHGESYRCHVGHAYTEQGLLSGMEANTESALWTALRIIDERKNLLQKIADKERKSGNRRMATHYAKRILELDKQINHLKSILFA
jgi:two-component system, chemotaxis family, protein-glutamate methylesterase/glutaminase